MTEAIEAPGLCRLALVAFEDRPSRFPFRFLKPGFRHCVCIIQQKNDWILVDPLMGSLHIEVLPKISFSDAVDGLVLGASMVLAGYISAPVDHRFSVRICSCVELVKRIIGVSNPGIWTPWQLKEHLVRRLAYVPLTPISGSSARSQLTMSSNRNISFK